MRFALRRSIPLLVAVLTPRGALLAQDRRAVVEPGVPPTCATLLAELEPVADTTLAERDERRLDTQRIQSAIDRCASGHAVVLAASGPRRAFLANLTTENAFDYPANAAKPDSDATKRRGSQGVALMTDMDADRSTFVNVKITGYQDTLFPNAGRSYFTKCVVSGNVDFIFGAGRAVFEDCDIVSRDRGSTTG